MALQVESFADEMEHLTDEQLKAKTPELKERIAKGEKFLMIFSMKHLLSVVKQPAVCLAYTLSTFKYGWDCLT